MSLDTPPSHDEQSTSGQTGRTGLRLPIARPVVTYILLGLIGIVFLAELFFESNGYQLNWAQVNADVAHGAYWQLLTSTFMHASLAHIAFNAYALYILGRDIEGLYGSLWFTVLYFLAGLAGSVAWYLFGVFTEPSVGASGAIFGLFGAEAAFFLRNRELFGSFGRRRLQNVVVLLVINFAIGFAVPNINYIAHLGGLIAGFLVGLFLTPSYTVERSQDGFSQGPRLADTRTNGQRLFVSVLTLLILLALVVVGNQHWAGQQAILASPALALGLH